MPKADDPFYNRKPVPKEIIRDIGDTGLSKQEEHVSRERKFSLKDGTDARKFGGKGWSGDQKDPFYGRKRVSDAEIHGVGETGLTEEQEFLNRERKYSLADGSDARKFSNTWSGDPKDPFYGRKQVKGKQINGVGETGMTAAEDYEVRERKQSLFQLNSDPFQELSGSGHRASISQGAAQVGAEATRRRSSAVAPNAALATQRHYADGAKLDTIESKPELPPVNGTSSLGASDSTAAENEINGGSHQPTTYHNTSGTTTGLAHGTEPIPSTTFTQTESSQPRTYYDATTYDDPDSVAPDQMR